MKKVFAIVFVLAFLLGACGAAPREAPSPSIAESAPEQTAAAPPQAEAPRVAKSLIRGMRTGGEAVALAATEASYVYDLRPESLFEHADVVALVRTLRADPPVLLKGEGLPRTRVYVDFLDLLKGEATAFDSFTVFGGTISLQTFKDAETVHDPKMGLDKMDAATLAGRFMDCYPDDFVDILEDRTYLVFLGHDTEQNELVQMALGYSTYLYDEATGRATSPLTDWSFELRELLQS